jgi:acetoacetyl-CoA reductase
VDYKACAEGLSKVSHEVGPVDILINNAGITRDTVFHKMTPEQWYEVINTNLNSLFNMTRPVIDGMRERGFGRIVNISSINGQKGQVGQTNYTASKSGDIGFTKSLAQENAGKGITVNTICPGYIATDMVKAVPAEVLEKSVLPLIPVRRPGEPEEVARCVVSLVAEESGFITGSTLTINGGNIWCNFFTGKMQANHQPRRQPGTPLLGVTAANGFIDTSGRSIQPSAPTRGARSCCRAACGTCRLEWASGWVLGA